MNTNEEILLQAQKRDVYGKRVKDLRAQGYVPAILYGHKLENVSIKTPDKELDQAIEKAGYSTLIDLKIDNEKATKVIASHPQFNPVTGKIIHIDFYRVKMDEKIKTEIPLEFIGESNAVKNLEGSLVQNKDSIEVECLPGNLVSGIQVDISALKTFEDSILIKDLKVPNGITVLDEPEEVVANVEPPRSEEELAELEESATEKEKEAIEQMETEAGAEEEEGGEAKEGEEKATDEARVEEKTEKRTPEDTNK